MSFAWPRYYNLPPFFTIQPVMQTQKKQLQLWCDLVLSYTRAKNIHMIDLTEAEDSELFNNKNIERKLSRQSIVIVLEYLIQRGNAKWVDKTKEKIQIVWRKPLEWANIIYKWATENGFINQICTVYELREGDMTQNEEFLDLIFKFLCKHFQNLNRRGKQRSFNQSQLMNLVLNFLHNEQKRTSQL